MSTLYELTAEYAALLELAEDPETDPEVLAGTFEAIEGEIEVKADGYARVIREAKGRRNTLKAEIDRMTAIVRGIDRNIDNMKYSLQQAMQATGKTKFKTDLFSFGIQKNPPTVVLDVPEDDLETIPAEYLIRQAPKVDKQKLKADLKAGKDLAGVAHLSNSSSLRIR